MWEIPHRATLAKLRRGGGGFFLGPHLAPNMSSTIKFLLLGLAVGYMASPVLDRVPVINRLPKIG